MQRVDFGCVNFEISSLCHPIKRFGSFGYLFKVNLGQNEHDQYGSTSSESSTLSGCQGSGNG